MIGGSLLKAVRAVSPDVELRVWSRRQDAADEILAGHLAQMASVDVAAVVEGADLIVLALPIEYMADAVAAFPDLATASSVGGEKVIVTDVGSVKNSVVEELTPLVAEKGGVFIGSHPMAGSEKTGLEFATADLFESAAVFVTPHIEGFHRETKAVSDFWAGLGAVVSLIAPDEHDQMVAAISHLPHVLASALAKSVFENEADALPFAAGGFRDTTRIASGAAEMWSGILMDNREAVQLQLDRFSNEIEEWKTVLESGDREKLHGFLAKAGECRERI